MSRTVRTVRRAALPAVAAAALLAACSSPSDAAPSSGTATSATASQTASVEAEILYLQRMARYGQQQKILADLALQKATSPEVRELATRTRADSEALGVDIAAVLQQLGSSVPAPGSQEGGDWPGILTPAQMAAVAAAPPAQLDRLWPAAMAQVTNEAITLTRLALPLSDPTVDRRLPTRIVEAVSPQYVRAMQIAGPAPQRATLPPR